jgi:hypothetical protein
MKPDIFAVTDKWALSHATDPNNDAAVDDRGGVGGDLAGDRYLPNAVALLWLHVR